MPNVSGWEKLPSEHRAWLLSQWRRSGWGDNQRIAAELGERLAAAPEAGIEPPGEVTVWRWAKKEQRRQAQIRYTAELRAATVAALPADQPELADRVGAYLEGRLVEAIEDLDAVEVEGADPIAKLEVLVSAHRATTDRRRAEIQRRNAELARERFEHELQIRAEERTKAAGAAEQAARAQGVSAEGIAALRAAIEGQL
jgi:hypothetical protein